MPARFLAVAALLGDTRRRIVVAGDRPDDDLRRLVKAATRKPKRRCLARGLPPWRTTSAAVLAPSTNAVHMMVAPRATVPEARATPLPTVLPAWNAAPVTVVAGRLLLTETARRSTCCRMPISIPPRGALHHASRPPFPGTARA